MDFWVETGETAGRIFQVLCEMGGDAKVSDIKKKVKSPVFDMALGWLLRENNVWMDKVKRTVYIHVD